MKLTPAQSRARRKPGKHLRARRDSTDFRDLTYTPSLVQVHRQLLPDPKSLSVLDQGEEGACTGFGLAASINTLLRMRDGRAASEVSPHMLYAMAKRYDQWPGEQYDGSSARGAMKGWHKHGVCLAAHWRAGEQQYLTGKALDSARLHPLGVYFRVLPKRIDLHTALAEVGVLFVSAGTHRGWDELDDGCIPFDPGFECDGGHAFAVVGYTEQGLLVQNSWGRDWGGVKLSGRRYPGCALWTYDDFEQNAWDVWVARMALPLASVQDTAQGVRRYANQHERGAPTRRAPPRATIRDHFVHIDDGRFDDKGDFYSHEPEVDDAIDAAARSGKRNIVLYAHGGLNTINDSAQRVAAWRPVFERNDVHELSFIWETGLWAEIWDLLAGKKPQVTERVGGFGDWWDNQLERMSYKAGHALWMEMIDDAERAFEPKGAGTHVVRRLVQALGALPKAKRPRVHLVGHSAGSIWHAHLLQAWHEAGGPPISNLILFAPACTHALFASHFRPRLLDGSIATFHNFLLDERRERDDNVAVLYRKSLLYLVSRSFQQKDTEIPLLGMERYKTNPALRGLGARACLYTPQSHPALTASNAHGAFDNDARTMNAMLDIVLKDAPSKVPPERFRALDLKGY